MFSTKINNEIKSFRDITNNSLIILMNENNLIVNDFIKLKNGIDYHNEDDVYLKKIYKSAYNLGRIMSKEKYLSIFLKLKITEL
jgi:hypothetical protein